MNRTITTVPLLGSADLVSFEIAVVSTSVIPNGRAGPGSQATARLEFPNRCFCTFQLA